MYDSSEHLEHPEPGPKDSDRAQFARFRFLLRRRPMRKTSHISSRLCFSFEMGVGAVGEAVLYHWRINTPTMLHFS